MTTVTTQAGRAVRAGTRPDAPAPDRTAPDRTAPDGSAPDGPGPDGPGPDGSEPATNRVSALRITPKLVWVVVALALVASLALAATRGREWYAARQTTQANAAALAAARQLATNFVTVDYSKVDADTARVKSGATGEFLKSYASSVEELKKVLVANQTVSSVGRVEAGLVSGDRDSAIALVGVVAPTRNTAVPNGETKTYRMRLELRLVGGDWKVENLEFVG